MEALRYNYNKPQWSLVDFDSLEPLVRVLEYGEHKYSIFCDEKGNTYKGSDITLDQAKSMQIISSGRNNWKLGFSNKLRVLESLARHLFALMRGEENDPESGLPHIGHILANCMFFSYHNRKDEIKSEI